jgi:hypothetical protein
MIRNIKWLLLVAATFIACNNDDEVTVVVSNSTDGSAINLRNSRFF